MVGSMIQLKAGDLVMYDPSLFGGRQRVFSCIKRMTQTFIELEDGTKWSIATHRRWGSGSNKLGGSMIYRTSKDYMADYARELKKAMALSVREKLYALAGDAMKLGKDVTASIYNAIKLIEQEYDIKEKNDADTTS